MNNWRQRCHVSPAAPMASSSTPIGSILPIGPVAQSTSDSKQTPPFTKDAASRELRAAILKRRKESRLWFSKAAEKDKEQGTQLGTLGFLPWEIRQQIIGMFRPKNSHRNRRGAVLDRCDSAPYILGMELSGIGRRHQLPRCIGEPRDRSRI